MVRKSQYATEYLLVVGIGLLILVPSIGLFYNYSMRQTDDAIFSRIGVIGRNIVNNAETVYYMGPPSRRTIQEEFPSRITNISIRNNSDSRPYYELVFYIGEARIEYPLSSNFIPIKGPFYHNTTGLNCSDAQVRGACFTKGKREIILDVKKEGNENFVHIIIR